MQKLIIDTHNQNTHTIKVIFCILIKKINFFFYLFLFISCPLKTNHAILIKILQNISPKKKKKINKTTNEICFNELIWHGSEFNLNSCSKGELFNESRS